MVFLIVLLILVSGFSAAIMVSRRIERTAIAFPVGIIVGIAVVALLYFLVTAVLFAGFMHGAQGGPLMPLE